MPHSKPLYIVLVLIYPLCHCTDLRGLAKVDPITLIASRSKVVRLIITTTSERGGGAREGGAHLGPGGFWQSRSRSPTLSLLTQVTTVWRRLHHSRLFKPFLCTPKALRLIYSRKHSERIQPRDKLYSASMCLCECTVDQGTCSSAPPSLSLSFPLRRRDAP